MLLEIARIKVAKRNLFWYQYKISHSFGICQYCKTVKAYKDLIMDRRMHAVFLVQMAKAHW